MNDDLISRKAAIDVLGKCPEAEWEEGWVAAPTGEYKQWLFAYHAILSTPSTCAVPLDKLCTALAENLGFPCQLYWICNEQKSGECEWRGTPCSEKPNCWKKVIKQLTEEQHG